MHAEPRVDSPLRAINTTLCEIHLSTFRTSVVLPMRHIEVHVEPHDMHL